MGHRTKPVRLGLVGVVDSVDLAELATSETLSDLADWVDANRVDLPIRHRPAGSLVPDTQLTSTHLQPVNTVVPAAVFDRRS
jgi:hypothetical protein